MNKISCVEREPGISSCTAGMRYMFHGHRTNEMREGKITLDWSYQITKRKCHYWRQHGMPAVTKDTSQSEAPAPSWFARSCLPSQGRQKDHFQTDLLSRACAHTHSAKCDWFGDSVQLKRCFDLAANRCGWNGSRDPTTQLHIIAFAHAASVWA